MPSWPQTWWSLSEKGVGPADCSGLALQGRGLDGALSLLQNALPSDEDEKDPNDPYRALDIDLDK